jgi:hypothetical protein
MRPRLLLPCPRKSNNLRTHTFECKKEKEKKELAFGICHRKSGQINVDISMHRIIPLSISLSSISSIIAFALLLLCFHHPHFPDPSVPGLLLLQL